LANLASVRMSNFGQMPGITAGRRGFAVARPFWSGQVQISLVSFGVKLFPAVEAKSEIRFHQIHRKSGERVRHQKVSEGDESPVEKEDIVKGYEYSKGEYIQIDPEEIANLRIPSKRTLELQQFVDLDELDPALFEKPYFVTPENDAQAEAFAVVRRALAETHKAGLGKIALSGREHLMALEAPSDEHLPGMIAYTLRFAAELRSAREYFAGIKTMEVNKESLDLAKELIRRKSAKFEPEKFTDQYEAALRELIDAKLKHLPVPTEQKAPQHGKVVNLMDALRQSVSAPGAKKPPARATSPREKGKQKVAVMPARGAEKRRKSA
jgi:DNA end-binding protein Ku